jgi:dTDP-4-dehydrorhamnose 3,5-epimerase
VIVERLAIPDLILLTPTKFGDERGFFSETWNGKRFAELGIAGPFVQDNHARSTEKFVLRGLHLQTSPNAQGKLVRVVQGAIWDVAVDVRQGSPTFGQYVGAELTAENWRQLWVPPGFLHGYCTLTPETEVIYKVTGEYDRFAERGVIWNDPTLAVRWPVPKGAAILSDKDKVLPRFADCPAWFHV